MTKKFPREMKRLSKPMKLTRGNIDKIPKNSHGIYVMRDIDGNILYVGVC